MDLRQGLAASGMAPQRKIFLRREKVAGVFAADLALFDGGASCRVKRRYLSATFLGLP
jgi:hypothetical protein